MIFTWCVWLISGKIREKKQGEGFDSGLGSQAKVPIHAIEDFCQRFDKAVTPAAVRPQFTHSRYTNGVLQCTKYVHVAVKAFAYSMYIYVIYFNCACHNLVFFVVDQQQLVTSSVWRHWMVWLWLAEERWLGAQHTSEGAAHAE